MKYASLALELFKHFWFPKCNKMTSCCYFKGSASMLLGFSHNFLSCLLSWKSLHSYFCGNLTAYETTILSVFW